MQLESQLLSLENDIKNANQVKDLVLERLFRNKIITDTILKDYTENYQIVVFKRSWFRRWFDKFAKDEKDNYIYKYLKFEEY